MTKEYISVGLMSGTSGDGVDASIIQSDGEKNYTSIEDEYFEYNDDIFNGVHNLKEKINSKKDLTKFSKELKDLEKKITFFHAKVVNLILKKSKYKIDLLGFHGQTIFHNSKDKITKQLGDGSLLSQLTRKNVIFNFRQNDINQGGEGAPLVPIFHKLIEKKLNIKPVTFINIGGITNITSINSSDKLYATDVGPGMCLIDQWVRSQTKEKYDYNGTLAKSGKVDKIILNQVLDNFFYLKKKQQQSFDVKDFDISFIRGLSLEDGAATLTEFTLNLILENLDRNNKKNNIILCGGGRKNLFLIDRMKDNGLLLKLIDDHGINGDFVESQAFAYLAIRSFLKKPISFPETTGVKYPCEGGELIKFK